MARWIRHVWTGSFQMSPSPGRRLSLSTSLIVPMTREGMRPAVTRTAPMCARSPSIVFRIRYSLNVSRSSAATRVTRNVRPSTFRSVVPVQNRKCPNVWSTGVFCGTNSADQVKFRASRIDR